MNGEQDDRIAELQALDRVGLNTVVLTACPECGAPAQAVAEMHLDRSPGYRYVRPLNEPSRVTCARLANGTCAHDEQDTPYHSMYRCVQCGGWFHKDCIEKHFHQTEHDGESRMPDAAYSERIITAHTIAGLQADVARWTVEKGWRDDRTVGDLLMLMVCELAEAYEEHRDWREPTEVYVHAGKPEGIPIELADVVIRILSFCSKYGIDLQDAVLRKMAYNETREFRHGGKRA